MESIDEHQPQVSRFRRLLPQVLATLAKNLLVLDIGLSNSFVTIALPALRGIESEGDSDEPIHLSDSESTWFVALGFVGQPIGSFLSGWLTEPLGRKRSMQLAHIPHLLAWMLMHKASNKWHVFCATVLISLGVGLMEAPIMTYVSEICEPSIRGQMLSLSMIAAMSGYFVVFLLGAIIEWRTVALVCWFCPLVGIVVTAYIPETPVWLLSHDRDDDALQSLRWLRGWVKAGAVAGELNALRDHLRPPGGLLRPTSMAGMSLCEQLKELVKPATMRPFALMVMLFVSIQFGGYTPLRPYMVQIFATLQLPLSAHWAIVGCSIVGLAGATICTICIRWLGKRVLYLGSVAVCVCCLMFIVYVERIAALLASALPSGTSSFAKPLPPPNENPSVTDWALLATFFLLVFMTTLGIYTTVFNLLAEVFPFRTRGVATGIACSVNFMLGFTLSKMFQVLETTLTIAGMFIMYACVLILCFFYSLANMPETENRTLDEVEKMYIK